LSTRSLLDDGFPDEVKAALDRFAVPAHLLELEITESAIMTDPLRARRLLTELAELGVRIAIDDFGTGYSSLAYLKDLPVNQLKIDQSFVQHMHEDLNDAIIVRSVVDLGHNLGLQTVAEGVEDAETWDQLAQLGCDDAQGYFLARPMPPAELIGWLQTSGRALTTGVDTADRAIV
jgi:EAL domain-containing protein (putative c-di-GMP-specific phosphodiesterase class I)